jgi:hypothetical protein
MRIPLLDAREKIVIIIMRYLRVGEQSLSERRSGR